MKVLLLGGTGVLSSEVCEEAINQGCDVYTVTRGCRKELLSDKAHNLIADVYNEQEMASVLQDMEFDIAVDFLVRFPEDLERTLRVLKNKCKQFIFVSTATVYKNTGDVISEKSEMGNHDWDYALYKEQSERLLKERGKDYVETYTIIRPYVTYGKTRIPSAIVPAEQWSLINRIINEKPIPLWDGGQAVINLTHTKDFAKGFIGLFGNSKAQLEDFHITSNEKVTWKTITENMAKAVGKELLSIDIPMEYMADMLPEFAGALRFDKSKSWIFDNAKICEAVPGLRFTISAEEGLKETIQYYLENEHMRKVDYFWEGKIDRMIQKYCRSHKIDFSVKQVSLKACKESVSLKDRCLYLIGRRMFFTKIYLFSLRVGRLLSRIYKRIKKR